MSRPPKTFPTPRNGRVTEPPELASLTDPGGNPMEAIELLRATLRELKDAGVARAQVAHEGLTLSVEFPLEMPEPLPGANPTPGGWKTLRLDEPTELNPQ